MATYYVLPEDTEKIGKIVQGVNRGVEKAKLDAERQSNEYQEGLRSALSAWKGFFEVTKAVPTPPIVYAIWYVMYRQRSLTPDSVCWREHEFNSPRQLYEGDSLMAEYGDCAQHVDWMPTVWPEGAVAPKDYEGLGFDLMLVDGFQGANLKQAPGYHDRNDPKMFWAHGGGRTRRILKRDKASLLGWESSSWASVELVDTIHPDILKLFSMSPEQLMGQFYSTMHKLMPNVY